MMKTIRGLFFLFLFFTCLNSFAGKLEKGFERLRIFDYFSAKEYFEKSFKDETAAAAYGLSLIFSSDKNPFYNPDSARKYILISDSTYKKLNEKTRKNYLQFDVSEKSILKLKEFICEDAYNLSSNFNTVEEYDRYLKYYSSCSQQTEATLMRNKVAFEDATKKNTSTAFKEYMTLYPDAVQYPEAVKNYEELIFEENTSDHSVQSYEKFIIDFPENPHHVQAETMIFSLTVPDKTIPEYTYYVRKYKNARYTEEAWREIYRLSIKDFSKESFNKFKEEFPDYPYPQEVESDFKLQNYFFLPIEVNDKWGYINEFGDTMITPQFDESTFYSDGLAAVLVKDKYGYVNKAGKIVIDFQFSDAEPFHNGNAIVKKDSLYGLINKKGDFLIQPKFQELSEASDNIYMAEKNDNAGYLRSNGDSITGFVFDLAGDFKNGFAIINQKEKFALLNSKGHFAIEPNYADLVFIADDLVKALSEKEAWGILNLHGDTIAPFEYDVIGEFHEHLALVSKKGKYGYINEKGEVIIPIRYLYTSSMLTMGNFQDGFAMIKQKSKSIPIDSTGKSIAFPGFADYGHPSEGLIPVKKNKKWGYCDMSGKIRIACKFDLAEPFKNGIANVIQNKLAGLIDTTGCEFISPMYSSIERKEKCILIKSDGKSGLLTNAGILLIPCSYDKIEFPSSSIAKASEESRMVYINLDSGKIIFDSVSK